MPALVLPLFPLCPLDTALRQVLKRAFQESEMRPSLPARPGGPAKALCPPAPERRSGADKASPSCTKKPPGRRLIAQFTPSPLPLDAPRAGRGKPLSAHKPGVQPGGGWIHPAAVSPHAFIVAPDHPLCGLAASRATASTALTPLTLGHSVLAMLRLALHGPPPKRVVRRR